MLHRKETIFVKVILNSRKMVIAIVEQIEQLRIVNE